MPTLDWIGKKAVLNHHREVPFHLLKCDNRRNRCLTRMFPNLAKKQKSYSKEQPSAKEDLVTGAVQ